MSYSTQPKVWYWVVTILFLLWFLVGISAFVAEMNDPTIVTATLTKKELATYNDLPGWYLPNVGIAVLTGTLACVAFLFQRNIAVRFALISFVAVGLSTFYNTIISGTWEILGIAEKGFTIFILIMSVLLVMFARMAAKRNWIR